MNIHKQFLDFIKNKEIKTISGICTKISFQIEGFVCEIHCLRYGIRVDNEISDTWFCGYIRIPKEHELYGLDYSEISGLNIYKGLTFSQNEYHSSIICNTLEDYKFKLGKGVFTKIGFDCNHFQDSPLVQDEYFIYNELENLVRQIINKQYSIERNSEFERLRKEEQEGDK